MPSETAPLVPQTRRLFLLALGRGRLQPPSMGVDGAIKFVRDRLLPQDQVAVAAFNRATDFTIDRDQILQVLERFKARHEAIEAKLRQYYSSWSAIYRGTGLPPEFQADIEAYDLGSMVSVMAFSEFGRRVEENGSDGTDHGTAGPVILVGQGVAGGLHSEYPSLTSLDGNGDLIHTMDFREIYADALENWLGAPSTEILEGTFTPAGVFRIQ